ncbi:hypothetical protein TPA0910_87370 [Streptomyces hygroscopicus subsp. sporocinereus]|uniref:Uncharacterized protein n=1 Tax=Streptomyces hygroscopicus TaxID=1912 RepID=A0ABQ3UFG8_STRHY|nr:hypothetical protein TPA0910_87370 [Streptomyces hygroscopicus]
MNAAFGGADAVGFPSAGQEAPPYLGALLHAGVDLGEFGFGDPVGGFGDVAGVHDGVPLLAAAGRGGWSVFDFEGCGDPARLETEPSDDPHDTCYVAINATTK